MSKKIRHETPRGFREVRLESERITYAPNNSVRLSHATFMGHVRLRFYRDAGKDVAKHVAKGHRFFFRTDLTSAFDQVTLERLKPALAFRSIDLALLNPPEHFFHENGVGGLIQGAPCSPFLFEMYCRFGGLDWDISEYCDKLGLHYSRYVDDILISSPRHLGKRIGPKLRTLVGKYGFELSAKKTKRVDVNVEPLHVLGYVVRNNRIDADPAVLEKLHDPLLSDQSRKGLFAYRKRARMLQTQTRNDVHKRPLPKR